MGRDPREHLPLTPAEFHVLVSLADNDKHGYAIIKEVAARTNGDVELSAGTLYALLKRLLNGGLVAESRRRPPAGDDDARRRYYRLTDFGRDVARAEGDRLESLLAAAREKRLVRRPV